MDDKFIFICIIFELILLILVVIKIKNAREFNSKQPPLSKKIIKNLKFK